jgi:T4-like virus tail tube protein gp19
MHITRRTLSALGAAFAAATLLAAAATAHAAPRTLNPQPEPPGVASDARAPSVGLMLDGVEVGRFSELAGMSATTVSLKRGKNQSMELHAWHASAARKSASLVMYATDGTPVARYHLELAWPAKIEIGGLKAGASEVLMAFESIETSV